MRRALNTHGVSGPTIEVFKSLEGASVSDYERRVNEVVLLAFQLRARRREARSRKATAQLPLIS
jgi:hypothetical protein